MSDNCLHFPQAWTSSLLQKFQMDKGQLHLRNDGYWLGIWLQAGAHVSGSCQGQDINQGR